MSVRADANEVPPLSLDEVIEILSRLGADAGHKPVLIGGQAVAIWGDVLADFVDAGNEPVTSGDVDFQGSAADARRAAVVLGGTANVPRKFDDATPNTGVVRFVDSAGNPRTLDFVDQPFGLAASAVEESAVAVELTGSCKSATLWLMHPRHCLESRIHNTGLPGRQTTLARRQLHASIQQARAYVRYLLEHGETRAALKLNEKMFRFALRNRRAGEVATSHGLEAFEAVALDPRLPDEFRTIRYPQMRDKIAERRRNQRRISGMTD